MFLGFSLLSGVEILYYFTIRAMCMVYKEREELERIQLEKSYKEGADKDIGRSFRLGKKRNKFGLNQKFVKSKEIFLENESIVKGGSNHFKQNDKFSKRRYNEDVFLRNENIRKNLENFALDYEKFELGIKHSRSRKRRTLKVSCFSLMFYWLFDSCYTKLKSTLK